MEAITHAVNMIQSRSQDATLVSVSGKCACRGRSVCSLCYHPDQYHENEYEDEEKTICWEVSIEAEASATNTINKKATRRIYYENEKDTTSTPTLASLQKAAGEASAAVSNATMNKAFRKKVSVYGYVVKFHKVDIAKEKKRRHLKDEAEYEYEEYDDMISSDELDYNYESANDFTPESGMYFTGQGDQVYCMAGEERDLTACDIDCGYCGRCGY